MNNPMLLLDVFSRAAHYNRWMNRRLYQHANRLDDAERRRDRGAFFGSLHGTLNHIMIGDRLWLSHWAGQGFGVALPADLHLADNLPRLDIELYATFAELESARERVDDVLIDWIGRLDEPLLLRDSVETADDGTLLREPLWMQVQHLFNHQTHHRGQATTLLMQAGIDPGSTDILAMPVP